MVVFIQGDEVNALGDSWMFLLWSSDSSPYLTQSMSSRFPIAVVPACRYAISETGVNLTLEALTSHIVRSFNQLSEQGVKLRGTGLTNLRAPAFWNILDAQCENVCCLFCL